MQVHAYIQVQGRHFEQLLCLMGITVELHNFCSYKRFNL